MRAKYHCTEEWLDGEGDDFSPEQNWIGAVNPTLTIIVNALRVGQHLTERLA